MNVNYNFQQKKKLLNQKMKSQIWNNQWIPLECCDGGGDNRNETTSPLFPPSRWAKKFGDGLCFHWNQ